MTTNKKKKEETNDSLMFAILLAVICILSVSLQSYRFIILNTSISFLVFITPIIIFISNYITKKYGFKDSLKASLISSLIIVAFIILIKDLTNQKLMFFDIALPFFIHFTVLFINLGIYYYDLINMEEHNLLTYINYIFTLALFHLFNLLYIHEYVLTNNFWKEYAISIIIGGILSIGGVYLDSKIKRGIEKQTKKKEKSK